MIIVVIYFTLGK